MKPSTPPGSPLALPFTGRAPARGRRLALRCALPAVIALGALGCSVRASGEAKSAGDTWSKSHASSSSDAQFSAKAEGSSRSRSSARLDGDARASAKAEGSNKTQSNVDAKLKAPIRLDTKVRVSGSDKANVKTSGKASAEGKVSASGSDRASVKTSGGKRVVFQTKPRVSGLAQAKTTPVFVGVTGSVHGSGSLHASGTVKGSVSGKDKDSKSKPAQAPKSEAAKNDKPTPAKAKPEKPPAKNGGKDPVAKDPKKETPKTPVAESPKTPVGEPPKQPETQPAPTPIDPPSEAPDNVFGYETPVRGCFEGLVYFIPENSQRLPKSYENLTSSAALYACEWDIPTRAWEQGFPGLEDRFEWFAIRYSGAFHVSQAGSWTFRISSDDGTRLYIDDKLVIDNDGVHSPKEKKAKIELTAGDHTMVLEYFQGPRYHINLQLFATPPGGTEGIFSVR